MTGISHVEQEGIHFLNVVFAGSLGDGDTGVVQMSAAFPGAVKTSVWEVSYELSDGGSSTRMSATSGPSPTIAVGPDGVFAAFFDFAGGLPPDTHVEVTACDEDRTFCDDIEYTVP